MSHSIFLSGRRYLPPTQVNYSLKKKNYLTYFDFEKGLHFFYYFCESLFVKCLLKEFESKLWITYRNNFSPIEFTTLTSDRGLLFKLFSFERSVLINFIYY
jgi:hypothetical protein